MTPLAIPFQIHTHFFTMLNDLFAPPKKEHQHPLKKNHPKNKKNTHLYGLVSTQTSAGDQ